MDHPVDFLRLKQHVQGGPVPDVQLVEPGFRMDSGPEPGLEVVRNHHVPAGVDEFIDSMGADVPGPAQNICFTSRFI